MEAAVWVVAAEAAEAVFRHFNAVENMSGLPVTGIEILLVQLGHPENG